MPSAAETSAADQLARLLAERRRLHDRHDDAMQRVNASWTKVQKVLPEATTTRLAGATNTTVVPAAAAPNNLDELQGSADRLLEQHTTLTANLERANGELVRVNQSFQSEALRRRRRRAARLGLLLIFAALVGAIWLRISMSM